MFYITIVNKLHTKNLPTKLTGYWVEGVAMTELSTLTHFE